ncbi:hypothetical protein C2857_005824 [Epichloe festucae Fl1]|uniref:Uncharacterized protein n=1 Tax=Epichloe festucae (strain Fl1) TaxID=877507 RepID=A0A7S9KL91_EPIFF|nr:hypothetical protein C2857_005824 [Epichloe festucae Fl1]
MGLLEGRSEAAPQFRFGAAASSASVWSCRVADWRYAPRTPLPSFGSVPRQSNRRQDNQAITLLDPLFWRNFLTCMADLYT